MLRKASVEVSRSGSCRIADADIVNIEIPTGVPIIYEFGAEGRGVEKRVLAS